MRPASATVIAPPALLRASSGAMWQLLSVLPGVVALAIPPSERIPTSACRLCNGRPKKRLDGFGLHGLLRDEYENAGRQRRDPRAEHADGAEAERVDEHSAQRRPD